MKATPRWFWLVLIFLTTQLVYLRTLNPAFPNDDTAETITAGVTLGLQHPPGYALAALIGRCSALLPLGSFGFRANWEASLWASLGAVLLTFILFSILNGAWFFPTVDKKGWIITFCAVWGGFSLAFSPTYWQNALSAKGGIYLLSVCFQLFILAELVDLAQHRNRIETKVLAMCFFLTGLGLANHWETLVIFIPAIFLFFVWIKNIKFPGWIQAGSFLVLGLSPLLYLPLRAHLNPILNLGDPDNRSYFLADFFRQYFSYREINFWEVWIRFLKGSVSLNQCVLVLHQIIESKGEALLLNLGWDTGWVCFGLALFGIGLWFRSSGKNILFFILLSWFLLWTSIFSYNALSNPESPWMALKFFLSSDWMIFLLASLALFYLFIKINFKRRTAGLLAMILAGCCLILTAKMNGEPIGQPFQTASYDYGKNLLKFLPARSLFFAEADEDYFSVYYLQQVEHLRPDVIMIPTFTLFEPWGIEQVEKGDPKLGLTASLVSFPDHFARMIYASSELVAKNKNDRPIAFSNFNGAFHQYYLDRQKNIKVWSSGLIWLLSNSKVQKDFFLTTGQLRIRDREDIQNSFDGSLEGIRKVYHLAGLGL